MKTHEADHCALVQPHYAAWDRQEFAAPDFDLEQDRTISKPEDHELRPSITPIDRVIIRDYFQQEDCDLPLELRRQGARTDGPLFSQETRLLPRDLEAGLSELPRGYKRVLIGADVALIEKATCMIVDVMRDARVTLS